MSMPIFSIVMPAYNAAATIQESIESVLSQSFTSFELLVVNDCSTDATSVVVEKFVSLDSRVRQFNQPENRGVAYARNIAISAAKGRYIAFLDADDLWLPHKLAEQHNFFQAGYDIVFSAYTKFWPDKREKLIVPPSNTTYLKMLSGNCIGNLTGAYDCEKLGKVYQKAIGHEDYLMWLELLKSSTRNMGISESLARYRVGVQSLSSSKIRAAFWMWSIYRDQLRIGRAKSFYYFMSYAKNAILKI